MCVNHCRSHSGSMWPYQTACWARTARKRLGLGLGLGFGFGFGSGKGAREGNDSIYVVSHARICFQSRLTSLFWVRVRVPVRVTVRVRVEESVPISERVSATNSFAVSS